MRQAPAVTPVLLSEASNNATDAIDGVDNIAFLPLVVPRAYCIRIFPDATINVRQLVRANTDYGAILVVEGGENLMLIAADTRNVKGEACDSIEFWAGEALKRADVKIIVYVIGNLCNDLFRSQRHYACFTEPLGNAKRPYLGRDCPYQEKRNFDGKRDE